MKIIIFGTGSCCENTLSKIKNEQVEIIGFCDNNPSKHGQLFHGVTIYHPNQLRLISYDRILIASEASSDIYNQLLELGVPSSMILPVLYTQFGRVRNELYREELRRIYNPDRIEVKREKKRVALLKTNNSGSNTLALAIQMPPYIANKYDVHVVYRDDLNDDSDYDLICTTSQSSVYDPSIINVQLWHGFPLKKIGTRTELFYKSYSDLARSFTNKIISYSELYSSLYNASFPSKPDKYEICGMPRNDLLFHRNTALITKLFGIDASDRRLLAYLPTYRVWKQDLIVNGDRTWDNLFGFKHFNLEQFATYLRDHHLFFLCKLHHMEFNQLDPYEYEAYSDVIRFIDEEQLIAEGIDLYQILASVDMLLTDYSSVYFDLLLRDIPLIFIPNDIDNYEKNRGFNLEPYDFWAPGPKAFDQQQLIDAIIQSFNHDQFSSARKQVRNIVHYYQDDQAHQRVWKLLDRMLEEGV